MLSQQLMKYGDRKSRFYVNEKSTAMVVRCAFSHFAGQVEQSPYMRIALNLGGGGIIREIHGDREVRRDWRKGSIYIGLGEPCEIDCPAVEILGIAVNLEAWRNEGICNYSTGDFSYAVSNPPSDNLVSLLLKALWESAASYGVDTELFNAGCLQILDRLANQQDSKISKPSNRGITAGVLAIVDEFIDQQMEHRITIAEMAASINMEEARFARAFTYSRGQTPFAYLTARRICKAQELLMKGTDITSTATTVGYSNPSKFAAAFRRYTGKSPSVWKRSVIS